jgi:hypothetical protein
MPSSLLHSPLFALKTRFKFDSKETSKPERDRQRCVSTLSDSAEPKGQGRCAIVESWKRTNRKPTEELA